MQTKLLVESWNGEGMKQEKPEYKGESKVKKEEDEEEIRRWGRPPAPKTKHWVPPPQGMYKVNIDTTVFKEQGCCGIGVVIRNDQGQLMGAMCKRVDFPLGALEAEAKVTKVGILLV